jgi:hypothetical protein
LEILFLNAVSFLTELIEKYGNRRLRKRLLIKKNAIGGMGLMFASQQAKRIIAGEAASINYGV